MSALLSVPLRFWTAEPCTRRGEPVTVGLPWPRGAVTGDRHFRLIGPDGSPQVLQTKVLDRWPDGSVRWCLFDFRATVDAAGEGEYRIESADEPTPASTVQPPLPLPLEPNVSVQIVGSSPVRFLLNVRDIESGHARTRVVLHPQLIGSLVLSGWMDLYPGLPVGRFRLTVTNSAPADHPGGNWDLGNGGSLYLRELSVRFDFADNSGDSSGRYSVARGEPFVHYKQAFELIQANSGGDNSRSVNHLDRRRALPINGPGFTLTAGGANTLGRRATPILVNDREDRYLGLAVPDFWENWPKTLHADRDSIRFGIFPRTVASEYELQGGEQKTHQFYYAFDPDTVTDEPMVWCRSPLVCFADPEWYAASGAVPYLTPKAADPNRDYLALVDQAIDGPDTFLAKREKIDEYGWRHFGDIYGDHEAVYWPGPEPMVSHYNNQYDCVGGLLTQFLRSGDPRWWTQAIECADHTCDIDIYHTDGDKAAYNHGLFWHTYHYAPADTGTHRSYPKSLRTGHHFDTGKDLSALGQTGKALTKAYAVGGGPAASHNYNLGLMLAYFLTGNPLYRDTAVGLAKFVIDMEDPNRTPFRWLSREFTGLATESGGGGYHGPGRASGNSVNALLVGHQLTGERVYLEKAEQLIRRVASPNQDLATLDLLNAELRWFYTMFLQALGRYLDYKADLGELDRMYAYGRLTLTHYARWMAEHERPILDTPERLQYPNETWAAQDMRKVEVFQYAAKHAAGAERERFLERAEWFFRYVERTLTGCPTKSLCRPVVLMLNFGWSRAWWQANPSAIAPVPAVSVRPEEFGPWRMFVPQKVIAVKRAKRLAAVGLAGGMLLVGAVAFWLLRG
jgi:hypothetical protein